MWERVTNAIQLEVLHYLCASSIFRVEVLSHRHRLMVREFGRRGVLWRRVRDSVCRQLSYGAALIEAWRAEPARCADMALSGSCPLQAINGEDWLSDGADCDFWVREVGAFRWLRRWLWQHHGDTDDEMREREKNGPVVGGEYGSDTSLFNFVSPHAADRVAQIISASSDILNRDWSAGRYDEGGRGAEEDDAEAAEKKDAGDGRAGAGGDDDGGGGGGAGGGGGGGGDSKGAEASAAYVDSVADRFDWDWCKCSWSPRRLVIAGKAAIRDRTAVFRRVYRRPGNDVYAHLLRRLMRYARRGYHGRISPDTLASLLDPDGFRREWPVNVAARLYRELRLMVLFLEPFVPLRPDTQHARSRDRDWDEPAYRSRTLGRTGGDEVGHPSGDVWATMLASCKRRHLRKDAIRVAEVRRTYTELEKSHEDGAKAGAAVRPSMRVLLTRLAQTAAPGSATATPELEPRTVRRVVDLNRINRLNARIRRVFKLVSAATAEKKSGSGAAAATTTTTTTVLDTETAFARSCAVHFRIVRKAKPDAVLCYSRLSESWPASSSRHSRSCFPHLLRRMIDYAVAVEDGVSPNDVCDGAALLEGVEQDIGHSHTTSVAFAGEEDGDEGRDRVAPSGHDAQRLWWQPRSSSSSSSFSAEVKRAEGGRALVSAADGADTGAAAAHDMDVLAIPDKMWHSPRTGHDVLSKVDTDTCAPVYQAWPLGAEAACFMHRYWADYWLLHVALVHGVPEQPVACASVLPWFAPTRRGLLEVAHRVFCASSGWNSELFADPEPGSVSPPSSSEPGSLATSRASKRTHV